MNHVATQENAQVTKSRLGGSAKVKVKCRELQMKSADMLQLFSYVCRMFHFGSSRLFQHIFDENEPNTSEPDVVLRQILKQTMKRQTVKMIFCRIAYLKRQTMDEFVSCMNSPSLAGP